MAGDFDRGPVRMTVPQAYQHAASEAAAAALIAHQERRRSGIGQHVDVSVQQAVLLATQSFVLAAQIGESEIVRSGDGMRMGDIRGRGVWAVKDGHISLAFLFGTGLGPFSRRLMEWIHEEGACDAATRDKDWIGYTQLLMSGEEPLEEFQRVQQVIADFLATKTKAEMLEAAQTRSLMLLPVSTIRDVVESDQLTYRDYWRDIAHLERAKSFRYPGPPAKFSGYQMDLARRAPLLGEHDAEIDEELQKGARPGRGALTDPTVPPEEPMLAHAEPAADGALAGLKVLDLMWVVAGPTATRVLADHGATVVRVESTQRVEILRTAGPFHDGTPGPENSGSFGNLNAGKLGLTVDVRTEAGREVILDLARWADVVTEAFSPGVMESWGLSYEALSAANPRIVMLSTCLFGQSGPLAQVAGIGSMAAALSGFANLAGWRDQSPVGPWGAYTDYLAPRYMLTSLLAVLEERDRTRTGQHIDLSQAEAALHFLTPALLDYTANGRVMERDGNRDSLYAPHGAFRAADDEWVAIAVGDDDEWRRLCAVMGHAALVDDPRYASAATRQKNFQELDTVLAEWVRTVTAQDVEDQLQAEAIPAHVVQGSVLAAADPQLLHRGHFVELPHPVHGTTVVEAPRFRLSRTPGRVRMCAPTFGRDNLLVLQDILGYDAERIAELTVAGALE